MTDYSTLSDDELDIGNQPFCAIIEREKKRPRTVRSSRGHEPQERVPMTDTTVSPLKCCANGEHCKHPESNHGWLPANAKYFRRDSELKSGLRAKCKACQSELVEPLRSLEPMKLELADGIAMAIPLSQGRFTVVDDVDVDLAQHAWSVSNQSGANTSYACRAIWENGRRVKTQQLHCVILARELERELLPGECVDHIDGDGLNNRRSNLRLATRAQNNRNRGPNRTNTSGVVGVTYDKRNAKWVARIRVDGRSITLGRYSDFDEACRIRGEAEQRYFGEFAPSLRNKS